MCVITKTKFLSCTTNVKNSDLANNKPEVNNFATITWERTFIFKRECVTAPGLLHKLYRSENDQIKKLPILFT